MERESQRRGGEGREGIRGEREGEVGYNVREGGRERERERERDESMV